MSINQPSASHSQPPTPANPQPRWLDRLLNTLLAPRLSIGLLRFLFFVMVSLVILIFLNWNRIPLFTPDKWPLPILVILPFFIGVEAAVVYIRSLYGVKWWTAFRFLLGAAFGVTLYRLRIQKGKQPDSVTNPMLRIGGPGLVQVKDDSIAIFERPDGSPYVVGPTTRPLFSIMGLEYAPIQGFDRLALTMDLHDQIMEWDVKARTRDGIILKASNLQVVFSVRRSKIKTPPSTQNLTYNPVAAINLVYQQGLGDQTLDKVIQPLIRKEFQSLIESQSLKELLTSIQLSDISNINLALISRNIPEIPQRSSDSSKIDPALNNRNIPEIPQQSSDNSKIDPALINYIPQQTSRRDVADRFTDLSKQFSRSTQQAGVQLEWINVGIWQFEAERIIQQHVDAWKMELENRNMTGKLPLTRMQQDAMHEELKQQIKEMFLKFSGLYRANMPREVIIQKMLSFFYSKLLTIRNNSTQPLPDELQETLTILLQHLGKKAGDQGAIYVERTN